MSRCIVQALIFSYYINGKIPLRFMFWVCCWCFLNFFLSFFFSFFFPQQPDGDLVVVQRLVSDVSADVK